MWPNYAEPEKGPIIERPNYAVTVPPVKPLPQHGRKRRERARADENLIGLKKAAAAIASPDGDGEFAKLINARAHGSLLPTINPRKTNTTRSAFVSRRRRKVVDDFGSLWGIFFG